MRLKRLDSNRNACQLAGVVIFDGDDTLWETQPIYDRAKRVFVKRMAALGLNSRKATNLLERVDVSNVRIYGFSKGRFPRSMVETYRELCAQASIPRSRAIERQIQAIGQSVFRVAPKVYPGTRRALRILRRHFLLALATKGDKRVQTQRIKALGLQDLFDRVYVLKKKDASEYARILNDLGLGPRSAIVVGDSVRSDINPALKLGIRAFWIPRRTWHFERATVRPGARVLGSVMEFADIALRRKSRLNRKIRVR